MVGKSLEEWRPVNEWYAVSSEGRVYSWPRERTAGGYLRQRTDSLGYKEVSIKARKVRVHRLVAIAFFGQQDGEVDHIDGTRDNNRADNLRWLSHKENTSRATKGVLNSQSKLTEDQVHWIRASKLSQYVIADWVGIGQPAVSSVKRGASWRHLL